MPDMAADWMPRERWDALVRGEDCPLCATIAAADPIDAYGYTVADLDMGRLRLAVDQFIPGYCVLICKVHVREPYHLPRDRRIAFFEDMMRAARALEAVFTPVKMNFELHGNAVPHLHCHLKPRFYGDAAPGAPLLHTPGRAVTLTPAEYERLVSDIRRALVEMASD